MLIFTNPSSDWLKVNVHINLNLSCVTSEVFIEHRINTTLYHHSTITSMLYKWINPHQPLMLSGFDNINVILMSENDKISSECREKGQAVELIKVKYQFPFHETISNNTERPKQRNFQFYHLRWAIHLLYI